MGLRGPLPEPIVPEAANEPYVSGFEVPNSHELAMSVCVEAQGPVTTIVIEGPQVRNAVDHETALALRPAHRRRRALRARAAALRNERGPA